LRRAYDVPSFPVYRPTAKASGGFGLRLYAPCRGREEERGDVDVVVVVEAVVLVAVAARHLPRLEEVHIVQVAVEVLVLGGRRRHVDPLLGRLDVAHVVRLHRAGVVPVVV